MGAEAEASATTGDGSASSDSTVWVGRVPISSANRPEEITEEFTKIGKVLSVTVRKKEGVKSWALVSFFEPDDARAAIAAGRQSKIILEGQILVVKACNIAKEVAKENTGALASVWRSQAEQITAAVRIRAVARGLLHRKG